MKALIILVFITQSYLCFSQNYKTYSGTRRVSTIEVGKNKHILPAITVHNIIHWVNLSNYAREKEIARYFSKDEAFSRAYKYQFEDFNQNRYSYNIRIEDDSNGNKISILWLYAEIDLDRGYIPLDYVKLDELLNDLKPYYDAKYSTTKKSIYAFVDSIDSHKLYTIAYSYWVENGVAYNSIECYLN